tara:strand:- start:50 stop:187 length:138 start_codon:yes stop_codon:yes gene_type:complete
MRINTNGIVIGKARNIIKTPKKKTIICKGFAEPALETPESKNLAE